MDNIGLIVPLCLLIPFALLGVTLCVGLVLRWIDARRAAAIDEEDTEKFHTRDFDELFDYPDTVKTIIGVLNTYRGPMKSKDIAFFSKLSRNTVAPTLSRWKVGNTKDNPGLFVHHPEEAAWSLSEYGPAIWHADED